MKLFHLATLIVCIACLSEANAQPPTYTKADSVEIVNLLNSAAQKAANSAEPLTLFFAKKLLNRPYVAHTLEVNDDERLVINTRQLDCTTLVETVAALTLCTLQDKHDFNEYTRVLTLLRYRKGRMNGYASRLHYFSDWIDDKQLMGIVTELQSPNPPFTAVQKLSINYMSSHPQFYKAMKGKPQLIADIAKQEQQLSGKTYRYIPKHSVRNTRLLRGIICDGDIIAITCNKPGLDIAHLGFAVWKPDGLHLLNASQLHKKVVIEPMTLSTYLSKHPTHTGIRIIRLCPKREASGL